MSFHVLASHWGAWLLASSIQLSLLFLLLWPLTAMLKRAPAAVRHFLWSLIGVKALLPPTLAAPLTIGDWGFGAVFQGAAGWGALFADPIRAFHGALGATADIGVLSSENPFEGLPDSAIVGIAILYTAFAVWSLGALQTLGASMLHLLRVNRALRAGAVVSEGPLHNLLLEAAASLGLRRTPRLVLAQGLSGPFLCGFFRATIALPATLPGDLSREELRAVLLHELVHYRRGDLAIAWLTVLVRTAFWFHPLVHEGMNRLAIEREHCVDEAVLESQSSAPATYGRALLNTLLAMRDGSTSALAFLGVRATPPTIEERIRRVLAHRRAPRRMRALAWTLAVLFAIEALPMSPPRAAANEMIGAPDPVAARTNLLPASEAKAR